MRDKDTQAVIDKIVDERVKLLSDIVRTGNERSAMTALLRLSYIRAKQSDRALIELIGELPEIWIDDIFSGEPSIRLMNWDAILNALKKLRNNSTHLDTSSEEIDPRILAAPPLWETVADAVQAHFKLHPAY